MTTTIKGNQTTKMLRAIQRGTQRAFKRGGDSGKTFAVRAIAADIGVAQKLVRPKVIVERPQPDTTAGIQIRMTGKRFRLVDVTAKKRPSVPGSFKATMRSGHKGIFKRKDATRSRKGMPRSSPQLPIREIYVVSTPYSAINAGLLKPILEATTAAVEKNLTHEVARAVSGAS